MLFTIIMEFNPRGSDGIGDRSATLETSDSKRGEEWVATMRKRYGKGDPILVEWYRSARRGGYKELIERKRYECEM